MTEEARKLAIVARADKYFGTGSPEYASDILRDAVALLRSPSHEAGTPCTCDYVERKFCKVHGEAGTQEPVALADHDEIGRKVLNQPWAIQSAIVTIAAHCRVLLDKYPTGDAADLAGCISQDCLELADALNIAVSRDVVGFRWRHRLGSQWFYGPEAPTRSDTIVEPLFTAPASHGATRESMPRASEEHQKIGWKLDFDAVMKLCDEVEKTTGYQVTHECAEEIILRTEATLRGERIQAKQDKDT